MGIESYPLNIPVVVKLLDNYIPESGKNWNYRETYGKDQTGVAFSQTHDKDINYKNNTNSK